MVSKNVPYDIDLKLKKSLAMSKKEYRELDDFCDLKGISISEFLADCSKSLMKERKGTRDIEKLMTNNKRFKEAKHTINDEINDELDIPRQGYSKLFREHIKKRIKDEED